MNLIVFFKLCFHLKTNLTALFFVEKQRVLPFKAEVHFKIFSKNRKKFLRHENILQGSDKILEEQEKFNFVWKNPVN